MDLWRPYFRKKGCKQSKTAQQVCSGYWQPDKFRIKHRLLCFSNTEHSDFWFLQPICCQYYPKLALLIYLNISISTLIAPWNSLLDKLELCIFLLTYFTYYMYFQVIKYMFTVIIILSTTLYSRHVVFIYLPLYTCLHVTDWKGALDSKH